MKLAQQMALIRLGSPKKKKKNMPTQQSSFHCCALRYTSLTQEGEIQEGGHHRLGGFHNVSERHCTSKEGDHLKMKGYEEMCSFCRSQHTGPVQQLVIFCFGSEELPAQHQEHSMRARQHQHGWPGGPASGVSTRQQHRWELNKSGCLLTLSVVRWLFLQASNAARDSAWSIGENKPALRL